MKPRSAWLEGTPAISIIFTFCFMIIPFFGLFEAATQLARQVHQERTQVVYSNKALGSNLYSKKKWGVCL